MAKNMNQYYAYGAALGFVVCALLACFYGQPMAFMENTLGLECVNCGTVVNATAGWDGICTWQIEDACCVDVPCPTCALIGGEVTSTYCDGDCPTPPGWEGYWVGVCTEKYQIYGGIDCVCEYTMQN